MKKEIGIAVLGLGWMGQAHSRSALRIPSLFPDRSFFVGSLPDDALGQKAVLFMEGSTVIDEHSLRVPTLESWEIPKEVIYLSKFETTSSGKMDRLKSVALYLNAQK